MSIFSKLKEGLQKTATTISRTFSSVFKDVKAWDADTYRQMERTLLESDFGPAVTASIVAEIKRRYEIGEIKTGEDASRVAAAYIADMLRPGSRSLNKAANGPTVVLFLGVNGSGKTTSIGKLACQWVSEGKKVMLAACDTFRAAAVEQLKLWGERSGATVIASKQGADAASVAYDAIQSAIAKDVDYLLIDTAGRQQNKKGLMDELTKLRRIVQKLMPEAPHETILTMDASLGLNALSQAREFASAAGASALIITKLDGTGKGGAACAVEQEFHLPILYIGVGEAPGDLHEFSPDEYGKAVFSLNEG